MFWDFSVRVVAELLPMDGSKPEAVGTSKPKQSDPARSAGTLTAK